MPPVATASGRTHVTLALAPHLGRRSVRLRLDPAARPAVDAAAATVARVLAGGETVYGVNTGFGLLARTRIDDARLAELQRALVRSHSAGTGALLDDATVRLILALKAASLACGYSGVRWEVIELIVRMSPTRASCRASRRRGRSAHRAIWRRSRISRRC